MLNKLMAFARQQDMIRPGDTVVCAVSGGADSVALLFALYLLRDKLEIQLEAAHFNHHLRGEESQRDAEFVRQLCHRYDIPLHMGESCVKPGEKGLEAAAREARYGFLNTLPGKIATAHTADDNAETILLHLIRGTGLKGLGGITPVNGRVIRPMLTVTRGDVEAFLDEYYVKHIEDSSNAEDAFLRNRIRHRVMPLLVQENPRLAENLSQMALRLRLDEDCLSSQAEIDPMPTVPQLRQMHSALRSRVLEKFLKASGVPEPEQTHIAMAEALVFSPKPSARASFPGGITLIRQYDRLTVCPQQEDLETAVLECPGTVEIPGYSIRCTPAQELIQNGETFTVCPVGPIQIRSRSSGDAIRLPGGSKSIKKLFIDRKIPAAQRSQIPVIADDQGILGVYGIGVNYERAAKELPAVTVHIIKRDLGG